MTTQKPLSLLNVLAALVPSCMILLIPLFLIYLVMFSRYGILALCYIAWMVYDRNTCHQGGRGFNSFRGLGLWRKLAGYFPMRLVKTVDLDPSRNYLLCAHPHGVYATSSWVNFSTEATGVRKLFPRIRPYFLALELQFLIPFHREWIQLLGMASSSVQSINHFLSDPKGGNAPVLVVGGVHEMLDAHPNTYDLNLKTRKGFVRLALQNGAPLVPVFTFGENELFRQFPNPKGSLLRRIQDVILNTLRVPLLTPTTFLPNRHPVTTVVGAPLIFEKIVNPTEEAIAQLHEKYVAALKDLFYSNRAKYGEAGRELNIL